ncbi:MAG: hypothetical protein D6758_12360 [Gammaproteobacteria bacterium]|nr:MAG: hypothetical protein D6758_12360 [Gammaproteobacteria bacterium]
MIRALSPAAWLTTAVAWAAPTTDWLDDTQVLYQTKQEAALKLTFQIPLNRITVSQSGKGRCVVQITLPPNVPRTLIPERSGTFPDNLAQWTLSGTANTLSLSIMASKIQGCRAQAGSQPSTLYLTLRTGDTRSASNNDLERAREALARQQPEQALKALQVHLDRHPNDTEALELLGVVQERLGQIAAARDTYQALLARLATGKARSRVQARLFALEAALADSNPALKDVRKKPEIRQAARSDLYGSVSSFYRSYFLDNPGGSTETVQSDLTTDADLVYRYRSGNLDIKSRLSGGYRNDFLGKSVNNGQLRAAYIDVLFKSSSQRLIAGRQSGPVGTLGRLDGLDYSLPVTKGLRLHAFGGFPVATTHDTSPDTSAHTLGLNLELTPPSRSYRTTVFVNQTTRDGLTERQAVGAEFRLTQPKQTGLLYLDYDVYFSELNTAYTQLGWQAADTDYLSFSLDYRRSPTLELSNATIGQSLTRLEQLQSAGFSEAELKEMALDRTAISKSAGVSWTHDYGNQWDTDINLDAWHLSGITDTQGNLLSAGTNTEYNLGMQLRRYGWPQKTDSLWWSLRYTHYTASDQISGSISARLHASSRLTWRPVLRLDRRALDTGATEWLLKPEVTLQFRPDKAWLWETTLGSEYIQSDQSGLSTDALDYYLYTGIVWSF